VPPFRSGPGGVPMIKREGGADFKGADLDEPNIRLVLHETGQERGSSLKDWEDLNYPYELGDRRKTEEKKKKRGERVGIRLACQD